LGSNLYTKKEIVGLPLLDDDVILDVAKSSGNTKEVTSLLIISNVFWEAGNSTIPENTCHLWHL
jgi:hypothetical protein